MNKMLKFGAKCVALLLALTIVGLPIAYIIMLLIGILEELEGIRFMLDVKEEKK